MDFSDSRNVAWAVESIVKFLGSGLDANKPLPASVRNELIFQLKKIYTSSQSGPATLFIRPMIELLISTARDKTPWLLLREKLLTLNDELANYEARFNDDSKTIVLERTIDHLAKEVSELKERIAEPVESELEVEEQEQDELRKYREAEKKAFVIMPFDPSFSDVWEGGIIRACHDTSFVPLRVDKISLSSWINEDIKENLKLATIVIADITDNNANVMFELGWALASKKDVIVICQKGFTDKVPFDIKGIRHIKYELGWSGIEALKEELKKYISGTEKKTRKGKAKAKPPKKPKEKNQG